MEGDGPMRSRFAGLALTFFAGLIPALSPAAPALAAAGDWAETDQGRVRLISAAQGVAADGRLDLGLQFQLEPGWKIYWRSPGDAGYPPQLDWAESRNLADPALSWPVPERFSLFGLETFGYGDEVILPIAARAADPGQGVELAAKLDFLVCDEICVPQEAELALTLPSGPAATSSHGVLIETYRRLVPGQGAEAGLGLESVGLTGDLENSVVEARATSETAFDAPDLLVEGPPAFSYGKPEVALEDEGRSALIRVPVLSRSGARSVIEGKPLTVTLIDGRRGLETTVIARFAEGAAPPFDLTALAVILGLAFIGGLILNVMPCVLPVLSLKLLSVVSHGGGERQAVRRGFLASAAGILASFLALALLVLGLKGAGMAVGWGIQFQQPLFLVALVLVLTLFAWNLFGLFEFHLPRALGGLGAQGDDKSLAGSFWTGALATLLATPCSAPYLGTAVGFALARGPLEIVAVFLALGLGMALPYVLVAAVPSLATRLPRPGPWMLWVKRVMGLALLGTAVWLLDVLWRESGLAAALAVAVMALATAPVLWLDLRRKLAPGVATAAILGLALAAFISPPILGNPAAPRFAGGAGDWRPLETVRIAGLVAQGKVVFVDVTADWCITCQYNKVRVLDDNRVVDRLEAAGAVTLRGDWTRPDPAISAYLESFGRYGIPFNAVYGPGLPAGKPLPELLSIDDVLTALDEAAGEPITGTRISRTP